MDLVENVSLAPCKLCRASQGRESIYSMIAFLALLLFGVRVNKVLQIFIFQTTPSFMVLWGEF